MGKITKAISNILNKLKCNCDCKSSCILNNEEIELVNFKKSLSLLDIEFIKHLFHNDEEFINNRMEFVKKKSESNLEKMNDDELKEQIKKSQLQIAKQNMI